MTHTRISNCNIYEGQRQYLFKLPVGDVEVFLQQGRYLIETGVKSGVELYSSTPDFTTIAAWLRVWAQKSKIHWVTFLLNFQNLCRLSSSAKLLKLGDYRQWVSELWRLKLGMGFPKFSASVAAKLYAAKFAVFATRLTQ